MTDSQRVVLRTLNSHASRDEYRSVYLKSDHWQRTRRAALDRAGNRCQVCNATTHLDVHHRTYERLGSEAPQDLTVLCRRCHDRHHNAPTGYDELVSAAEALREIRRAILLGIVFTAGPITSKAVAETTGWRSAIVGGSLSSLQTRGLVRPGAKRRTWEITPEGREWVESFGGHPMVA